MIAAPKHPQSFIWLDVARAAAAALVLAGHLRAFVFTDFVSSGHLGTAWKVFYFLTSLQHHAVIVFFVLSGFLISRTVSQQAAAHSWTWSSYALKRLSRLWIVLLPALILTLIWDQCGMRSGSPLYSGNLNAVNHSTPVGALSYTLPTFLGNVAFLQSIVVPPFGTDTPLWSLANEFWYYVVFPLLYFACRSYYQPATRVGLACAGTALCLWLLPTQCPLGLVWLLGYGAYVVHDRLNHHSRTVRAAYAAAAALLFFTSLVAVRAFGVDGFRQDFIVGLCFAVLVAPLAGLKAAPGVAKSAHVFAGFSYTLYAVHFPFIAFVTSAIMGNARFAPGGKAVTIFALLFTVVMAYAYLVSFLFERNTPRIQGMLMRRLAGWAGDKWPAKIALRTE